PRRSDGLRDVQPGALLDRRGGESERSVVNRAGPVRRGRDARVRRGVPPCRSALGNRHSRAVLRLRGRDVGLHGCRVFRRWTNAARAAGHRDRSPGELTAARAPMWCQTVSRRSRFELRAWEAVYNTIWPHQALGYLTPAEYLRL